MWKSFTGKQFSFLARAFIIITHDMETIEDIFKFQ